MRGASIVAAVATGLALAGSAAAQEVTAYTYDGQGRLVRVEHSGTVNDGLEVCYALDDADNRTERDTDGAGAVDCEPEQARAPDDPEPPPQPEPGP